MKRNTIRKLVWEQIRNRNTFELLLSSILVSLSFWKIVTDTLNYSPSEYFVKILELYPEGFEQVGKIVLQLIELLGLKIEVTGIWLHLFVLGFFYILVDARGFFSSRKNLAYVVVYLIICFLIITASSVFVDSYLLGNEQTLKSEFLVFFVWLFAIGVCELADVIQTAFWPSVRKEWSAYYGCGDNDILCLIRRGAKRLFLWQVILPLLVISPIIYFTYTADKFSEGILGIVFYLLYLMVYWIVDDLDNYSRAEGGLTLADFLAESYNWRLGIGLLVGAIAIVLTGIVGIAYS
ncbi:hypothetical protein Glaag_3014 [Glaciecola sp. 4H-3-7+YE-5]|nr:hypothetical protein Glaag_3014 [Glaciecola sp. 4H-3-7+YE-5]